MQNSKTDQLIKNIESMEFKFPYPSEGHGVDRLTGEGDATENISDEEGVELFLRIHGEEGRVRVIDGDKAMKIYEIVWHFLNQS